MHRVLYSVHRDLNKRDVFFGGIFFFLNKLILSRGVAKIGIFIE